MFHLHGISSVNFYPAQNRCKIRCLVATHTQPYYSTMVLDTLFVCAMWCLTTWCLVKMINTPLRFESFMVQRASPSLFYWIPVPPCMTHSCSQVIHNAIAAVRNRRIHFLRSWRKDWIRFGWCCRQNLIKNFIYVVVNCTKRRTNTILLAPVISPILVFSYR